MDYKKIYDDLILRAQGRASTKKAANAILGYCERHHILPRCMGGTDEKNNFAYLSAREHFIAHLLLVKIYPKEKKLLYACHRLLYDKQGNKHNGKSYSWIKLQISEYRKTQNKFNNEGLARSAVKQTGRNKDNYEPIAIGAAKQRGRTKDTHEGIAAAAEKRKGRNKDNYEPIQIASMKMTGRTKDTHPGPKKISEKKTGQTKETCPGVAEMAQKLTGRTKETHSYLAEKSVRMTGQTKENNLSIRKKAETKKKLSEEIEYEMFCKREAGWKLKEIYQWVISVSDITIGASSVSRICNAYKRKIQDNSDFTHE